MDTTNRPLCVQGQTGAAAFKRYEHLLYLLAQLSRIVYCDSGIAWEILRKSFGRSNDIVNQILTQVERSHAADTRVLLDGFGLERPMRTYQLTPASPTDTDRQGLYIATPDDVTCLMVRGSLVTPNASSIIQPTDVLVAFKGSSTIDNFIQDAKSQLIPMSLGSSGGAVPKSFLVPLQRAFPTLQAGLQALGAKRLFLTGHSLGGAHATLLAFLLAEAGMKDIHLVTFGAPAVFNDAGRNAFNKHLDSGAITLDRVVVQSFESRLGRFASAGAGSDPIPNLPAGYSHPGYRPLATELGTDPKRPTTMRGVRALYGISSSTNGRDPQTWPFPEPPTLWDKANAAALADATVGGGTEKDLYAATTRQRMPNFLGVSGSLWMKGFPHGEYLGMFFLGALRLPGRKNPARKSIAWFELVPSGVRITYRGGGGRTRRVRRRGTRRSWRGSRYGGSRS